jgi:hypothetical protein
LSVLLTKFGKPGFKKDISYCCEDIKHIPVYRMHIYGHVLTPMTHDHDHNEHLETRTDKVNTS